MSLKVSFVNTLYDVGINDDKLVVLVGDISHFRLQKFADACPNRYHNVGICENTIISMAAGLSSLGFYPVVHTISPFLVERSFEHIKLDLAYQNFGATIATVGCAFDYADLGATHHCYGDFALIKTIPNSQIFYPTAEVEFDELFKQNYKNGKINYFRLPSYDNNMTIERDKIKTGKGLLLDNGDDITIIAVGIQVGNAIEAVNLLKLDGIKASLIYIHTIKPLDYSLILSCIDRTKNFLVIEEHSEFGGVYDDVLRGLNNNMSISIPNKFIREYGTYKQHCDRLGFSSSNILNRVKNILHE